MRHLRGLRGVKELSDQAVAAPPRLDVAAWRAGFDEVFARIAVRFAQACSRKRARAYLLGLLSPTERKSGGRWRRWPVTRRRRGCSGC